MRAMSSHRDADVTMRPLALFCAVSWLVVSILLYHGIATGALQPLRWSVAHPGPVEGYRVHYSFSPDGDYTGEIDVAVPPRQEDGSYLVVVDIPGKATVYIALSAYVATLESGFSNEIIRIGP